MKRIIISADDFGRNPYRNKAVDEAFNLGLIQSAALIVNSQSTLEAIELAKGGGYLDRIHLHFNFTGGQRNDYAVISDEMKRCKELTDGVNFNLFTSLPHTRLKNIGSLRMQHFFYEEMVAQYELFLSLTMGRANNSHIDFHCWYNLDWPVAVALRKFTKAYHIKSCRYIGGQHEKDFNMRLLYHLGHYPSVQSYRSCSLYYYLHNVDKYQKDDIIEVYVHPDYWTGELLDNTSTIYNKSMRLLSDNIGELSKVEDLCFISWASI